MAETAEELAVLLEQADARDASTGFAGVVLTDESALTVFWKGGEAAMPRDLTAMLSPPSAPSNIVVEISAALHSAEELRAQRDAIRSDAGFPSSGITAMAIEPDGSGLYITGDPARANQLDAVRNSPVPLHFNPSGAVRPAR